MRISDPPPRNELKSAPAPAPAFVHGSSLGPLLTQGLIMKSACSSLPLNRRRFVHDVRARSIEGPRPSRRPDSLEQPRTDDPFPTVLPKLDASLAGFVLVSLVRGYCYQRWEALLVSCFVPMVAVWESCGRDDPPGPGQPSVMYQDCLLEVDQDTST
jgi:hypothetical protein